MLFLAEGKKQKQIKGPGIVSWEVPMRVALVKYNVEEGWMGKQRATKTTGPR